jgi:hypothetical protein
MADDRGSKDADGLAWLALLYAGGELDPGEAALFEQRLAGDQQAREALAQATPLALPPGQPLTPDPAYRQRVHRRLRRRPRPAGLQCSMSWLVRRRSYPGHPVLWTSAGAAAAALLTTLTFLLGMPGTPPVAVGPRPEAAASGENEAPAGPPAQADVANAWARLHTTEHVARAHDEEMRRKSRNDQRTRPAAKSDDRHGHPMGNQGNKR